MRGDKKNPANTAVVATEEMSEGQFPFVRVHILDGEDEGHAFDIDRPAAARKLIEAGQAYLRLVGES